MLTFVNISLLVNIGEGVKCMVIELKKDGKPKAQEVEPIKNVKDIQKIKQYLLGKDNKRDYLLFALGINIGLRAGDLLTLRVGDVAEIDVKGKVHIKDAVRILEEKTEKVREFAINKSASEAITTYLNSQKSCDLEDYLFVSRKGNNESLTVESAHKIIKTTMRELKIKGNFGTHTLRKTFAYHIYANNIKENPSIVETLQRILNHSSSAITLRYIGITKEVITDVYNTLNL